MILLSTCQISNRKKEYLRELDPAETLISKQINETKTLAATNKDVTDCKSTVRSTVAQKHQ